MLKVALITCICNYYTAKKANLALQSPHKPFKGQNVLWRPEFWKEWEKIFLESWKVLKMRLKLFFIIFQYLLIFRPSEHILAFKRLVWNLYSQIGLFCSIIIAYGCNKGNFKHFDVLLCDLAFLAIGAAFLALMTLKLQNLEIT